MTATRNEKAGAGTISVKVETRDAHNCNKERKEGCRHNSKCRIEKAATGTMTATRNEKETRGQNTQNAETGTTQSMNEKATIAGATPNAETGTTTATRTAKRIENAK